MGLDDYVAQFFGVVHFDDVLHLLVGNVPVVVSVNLPDGPYHLRKLSLICQDMLELAKFNFLLLPLFPIKHSVVASSVLHIHNLLVSPEPYHFVVIIYVFVALE